MYFLYLRVFIPKDVSFIIGNVGASSSGILRSAASDVTSTRDVRQYRTPKIADGTRNRQFVQIVKDQKRVRGLSGPNDKLLKSFQKNIFY